MSPGVPENFTTAVLRFASDLQGEHAFAASRAKVLDALRAAEIVGVTQRRKLRDAFRLTFCTSPDEAHRFDPLFDAFFTGAEGVPQPDLPPRRVIGRTTSGDENAGAAVRRSSTADQGADAARRWQTLRARYSAAAGASEPPEIGIDGLDRMMTAAQRLVARVRLGRSRRWKPARDGARFDVRRTLRASLQTGGDPIALHRLGPPLRNARFVVLLDGSRSMAEHVGPALQFAYALCLRSRRAHVFVFSTSVADVTRELREPGRAGTRLDGLGTAWGGGTRIGASLETVVRARGARLLTRETVVFIASDGIDVGDLAGLERAMRALRSRTAGVVWLHPHAGRPGFRPTTAGMRTALPFLTLLVPAASTRDFARVADAVAHLIGGESAALRG
jgi:uncharacterized protein